MPPSIFARRRRWVVAHVLADDDDTVHKLLRGRLAAFADLVDSGKKAAARQAKRGRVDDTDDEQFGSKSARDLKRFVRGRTRSR